MTKPVLGCKVFWQIERRLSGEANTPTANMGYTKKRAFVVIIIIIVVTAVIALLKSSILPR